MATALRSCLLLAVMLATLQAIPAKSVKPNSNQQATLNSNPFDVPSVLAVDVVANLQNTIAFLNGQLKTRGAEIEHFKLENKQLEDEILENIATCDARVAACEANLTALAARCQGEMAKCQSDCAAAKLLLQQHLAALTVEQNKMKLEITQLKAEIEELLRRLKVAEDKLKICSDRTNVLTSDNANLKATMDSQAKACATKTTQLQSENAALQNTTQLQTSQIQDLERRLKVAEDNLKICSDRSSVLTTDNTNLKTALATCNAKTTQLQSDVTALQGANQQQATQIQDLMKRLKVAEDNLKICSDKSSVLTSDNANLKAALATCNAKTTQLQSDNAAQASQIKVAASAETALKLQIQDQTNQLLALNLQLNAFNTLPCVVSKVRELGMVLLGSQYYYFSTNSSMKNYPNSQAFCRSHGLYLASVETGAEHKLLYQHMTAIGQWDSWLGGTDEVTEARWVWSRTGQVLSFTNWHTNQPSPNNRDRNCLDMRSTGWWYDLMCSYVQPFICEW